MEKNEQNLNARGGTELLMERLHEEFPHIHEDIQIIPSRVRNLDPSRKRILYLHDLAQDPEVKKLSDPEWVKNFDHIVFVSEWQRMMYHYVHRLDLDKTSVIYNSITPIFENPNPRTSDKVRLIYHSTPHRGLNLLYDVFSELVDEKYGDAVELSVFSSFELYGWKSRDKPFEDLFKRLDDHPQITNWGTVPNDRIRQELVDHDIFAYPSTWQETSCLCLIEAMSAKCVCVHSSLAALPETSGLLTNMYEFTLNEEEHKKRFKVYLETSIDDVLNDSVRQTSLRYSAKDRADLVFDEAVAYDKWERVFRDILNS